MRFEEHRPGRRERALATRRWRSATAPPRAARTQLQSPFLVAILLALVPWAGATADCRAAASRREARAEKTERTARARSLDKEAIGRIVGVPAQASEGDVIRCTWARSEIPVSIDGMRLPPAAGLTSWAGFAPSGGGAMVMGDTVVFQDEVDVAMDAAFAHGLSVTALHNHFFYDQPKVYFLHLAGEGEIDALARGVRAVWDAIRELRAKRPVPAESFAGATPAPGGELDAAAIGEIVGTEPSVRDGVVKVDFARKASAGGAEIAGPMGVASWAAFTGSDQLAAMDGDVAMTAAEVQPVLRALRKAGIHVVAVHNHMIGEEPTYFFVHFWGKGPAIDLARGFRSALDALKR